MIRERKFEEKVLIVNIFCEKEVLGSLPLPVMTDSFSVICTNLLVR